MKCTLAPFARRWRHAVAALSAALGLAAPGFAPAFNVCNDFGGVPAPLSSEVGPLPFNGGTYTVVSLFDGNSGNLYNESGAGVITDMDVSFKIAHPRIRDLAIWLRHRVPNETPGGTPDIVSVGLYAGEGCDPASFDPNSIFNQDLAVYFDDQAQSSILFACDQTIPTVSGRYSPPDRGFVIKERSTELIGENGLASFNGARILEGTWELVIMDFGSTGEAASLLEYCIKWNQMEEGDISPREETGTINNGQTGNGIVTISDHTDAGLHLLRYLQFDERILQGQHLNLNIYSALVFPLQPPVFQAVSLYNSLTENIRRSSGTEFTRLDTAPRANAGDGRIDVADWVQIGRYAAGAGFDEAAPAGGPLSGADRIVRIGNVAVPRGQVVDIPVVMRSRGVEHELAFGIEFDTELLEFVDARRGSCIPSNAIFQLNNQAQANETGVLGLQVGLLPDQSFLCNLTPPAPALSGASGPIANTLLDSTSTRPASFLYDVTSTVSGIDFTNPNAPVVTVGLLVSSMATDTIRDYSFGVTYDQTRLAYIDGSLTNSASFGGSGQATVVPRPGQFGRLNIQSANAASTFVSGQLLTMRFSVIAGQAFDSLGNPILGPDGAPVTSTTPPTITLGKGTRAVFNTTVVEDNRTPLFRARFNSTATNPIVSVPKIALLNQGGTGTETDCAGTDPYSIDLVVSNNIAPITAFNLLSSHALGALNFSDAFIPPAETRFAGAVTAAQGTVIQTRLTTIVSAEDSNSQFFNGRLLRLVFERQGATADHVVSVQGTAASANRILSSGETVLRSNAPGDPDSITRTRYEFLFDCAAGKSTDLADLGPATETEEAPAAPKALGDGPPPIPTGPVLSTRFASVRRSGASTLLDVDLVVANNSTVVTSYEFFLTFDRYSLDLASPIAVEGGAGFGAVPVVDLTPTILRGNYATHRVTGTSAGSSLVNGRLARFTFVLRSPSNPLIAKAGAPDFDFRGLVTPPSIFISNRPPVETETQVATLSFRAKPGTGAVPTTLAFVAEPQTFVAPSVRNVGGVPIYSHFASGGITILDNSDARPVVRLRDAVLQANEGDQLVDIVLDSVGIENAVGFTLNFNSADLEIQSVSRGRDIPFAGYFYTLPNENDTTGLANTSELKILTSLQPGATFAAGERVIATLRVRTRDSINTFDTALTFTELYPNPPLLEEAGRAPSELVRSPRRGQVVDPDAIPLVADFPDGKITVAGTNCIYTVAPTTQTIPAVGGAFALTVNVPSGCPWTAVADAGWIRITENASGNGTNTIRYVVDPNDSCEPRTGQIQVAGKPLNITQQPCVINLGPETITSAGTGGNFSLNVLTDSVCSWTLVANVTWITFTSANTGQGPAAVSFRVSENVGQPRTGLIQLVSCATGTVTQVAVNQIICEYALNPAGPRSFAAAGGDGTFNVVTTSGCPWQATATAPWIELLTTSGDSVNNVVSYRVLPNEEIATPENSSGTPPVRRALINVAGRSYEITQAFAACSFTLVPADTLVDARARSASIRLNASDEACGWEATLEFAGNITPWVRFTGPTSGNGSITLELALDSNDSPVTARVATLSISRGGVQVASATIRQLQRDNTFFFEFVANPESDINGSGGPLTDDDKWVSFSPGAPNFSAPTFSESPATTADGPGRLSITSTSNVNNFGWWNSPALRTEPATRTGNVFKATYLVSSTSSLSANVPVFRLRASSTDFQQSDVMIVTSNGNGVLSPSSAASHEYTHLFSLPPQANFSAQSFQLYFELLNFGGEDPSGQTIALERILVSPFNPATDLAGERTERTYILSQPESASAFQQIVPSVFTRPVFGATNRGLTATSSFTGTSNPPTTIGFLTADTGVAIQPGRIYAAEVTVSASAQTALSVRKSLVPTFRARLNSGDFTASSYVNIESIDDNSRVPTFTEKQLYTAWLMPTATRPATGAAATSAGNVLVSFDYLLTPESFNTTEEYRNAADIILIVESVRIKSFVLAP